MECSLVASDVKQSQISWILSEFKMVLSDPRSPGEDSVAEDLDVEAVT